MAHRAYRPHNFRALSKPKELSKIEHRHYLPYLPVLLLVIGTFLISLAQPLRARRGVLAYATSMSTSALLDATNKKREQNGAGDLQINNSLSAAAQAKANDMIKRNYWAHVTPDGQQPWVFIDGVGYKYQKAGENLAYGFTTSDGAVTGWMNSPSHRENMLDTAFTEVGFGYANGPDFNNSGAETVVVAEYGRPLVLGDSQSIPLSPSKALPVTTASKQTTEPDTQAVSRIQSLFGSATPSWAVFAVGLVTGLAIMLLLLKHAAGLRHLIKDSKRFVLHHPLLDTILVSLVLVGSFLSQTTGFIR